MIESLYFRPGTVFLYKNYMFKDTGEKRDKYFLCLTYKTNNIIFATITTSQNRDTKFLDYFKIKAGENCLIGERKYFIKDTYFRIDNDRITEFNHKKIVDKYNAEKIVYIGILKIEYLREIIKKISRCETIEILKIKLILESYNKYCYEMKYKEYELDIFMT